MPVSQEQFEDYLVVQKSGLTNMFNRHAVCDLSDLPLEVVTEIMGSYAELAESFDIDDASIEDRALELRSSFGMEV